MTHLVPHLNLKWGYEENILRLVSFTSLASPTTAAAAAAACSPVQPSRPPACLPACPVLTHQALRAQTSWDLPVLCAAGVAVKTQQVRGGCRPPLRCSGTTGVLICTLSQPSLLVNPRWEGDCCGRTETHRREEGGWWAG